MRYMIIIKATKDSEAGVLPPEHLLEEMAAYHGELAKAGVLVDGSGLQATSKGWRVKYRGARQVRDRRPVCGNQGTHRRLHDH